MGNLDHIKLLRTDMEAKGWTISSFIFVYKNIKNMSFSLNYL